MLKCTLLLSFLIYGIGLFANVDSIYQQAIDLKDIDLAKEAYKVAISNDNEKVAANSLYLVGWLYRQQEDYLHAMKYYLEAAEKYKELNQTTQVADLYDNIGTIFYKLRHYQNAKDMYKRSISLRKTQELNKNYYQTLFNIGVANRALEKYDSALYYYNLAISGFKYYEDQKRLIDALNDIGLVREMQENYELANQCYLKTLELAKQEVDSLRESRALHNLGSVSIKKTKYEYSLGWSYYDQALKIRNELGDASLITSTLDNLKGLYLHHDLIDSAHQYFLMVLDYAEYVDKDLLMNAYLQLSIIEELNGEIAAALNYTRQFQKIVQELDSENKELEDSELFLKGELALSQLTEHEHFQEDKESWLFTIAFSIICFSILSGIVIYYYIRARSRKRTLDLIVKDLTQ